MSPTVTHLALTARVAAIASSIFDPADLSAISLDDRLRTRCAAVLVLSHAEIEEAIETACIATVDALEDHPPVGFAFLAWGLSASQIGKPNQADHNKQKKAEGTVKYLLSTYRGVVASSHGIREANLQRLLLPLGIKLAPLSLDIATLDNFGHQRGDAAHLSPLKARLQDAPSVIESKARGAALAAERVIDELEALQTSLRGGLNLRPPQATLFSRIRALLPFSIQSQ